MPKNKEATDAKPEKETAPVEYHVLRSITVPEAPAADPRRPGAAAGTTITLTPERADAINASVPGNPALRRA